MQDIVNAVISLNAEDKPFQYSMNGNEIIGEWKYLDAIWAAPLGAGDIDESFKLIITLDEASKTYTSTDISTKHESGIKFNPANGKIQFGSETNGFIGNKNEKSFSFGLGKARQEQNQGPGGVTYVSKFDTDMIKTPIFELLSSMGWKKKSGLLSRLFG